MSTLREFYWSLGLLEGTGELFEYCDEEYLASLPRQQKDRLERGRLLEFLIYGSPNQCKSLVRQVSAYSDMHKKLFEIQHPEEAAEYQGILDDLANGVAN